MKVLLILAHGFEEVEAVSVIDVLRRAEIGVTIAGLAYSLVTSARQLQVIADVTLPSVSSILFDAVILPGGEPGTTSLESSELVSDIILNHYKQDKLIAAICAAPRVLHGLGILHGKKATAFPSVRRQMTNCSTMNAAVVEDGQIITGRDAGASLKFALTIVGKLRGETEANIIAKRIGLA